MTDPASPSPGVTPPPAGTPSIPVAPTSDNPGSGGVAPSPAVPAPGAPAWGQAGYGAPPAPPAPAKPNPLIENLKADLIGTFPSPTDASHGRLWSILSYLPGVFLPLWLVPLVRRNNHLSLFHAKQMLGFAAVEIPASLAFMIVNMFVAKIPKAGGILSMILSGMFAAGLLLVAVIGLLGALKGQVKPLPLIGRMVDRMTRALTVVAPTPNAEPQLAYWMRVAPVARPQTPPPGWQPPPQPPSQPASAPAPAAPPAAPPPHA